MSAQARTLQQAEDRLQHVLEQLHQAAESARSDTLGRHSSEDYQQTIQQYQDRLTELDNENKHLREEVSALQRQNGAAQDSIVHYKKVCDEATKRIDELLNELESL